MEVTTENYQGHPARFSVQSVCHERRGRQREDSKDRERENKENWQERIWKLGLFWNKQEQLKAGDTHTHTERERERQANVGSGLCSSACWCVDNRRTHTSGCHNSSSSHKNKEKKREKEAYRCYQHNTHKKTTRLSLSGRIVESATRLPALPKHTNKLHLNPTNAAVSADLSSSAPPSDLIHSLYRRNKTSAPLMQQTLFISFAYYYIHLVLPWHFAGVAAGRYLLSHGPGALLKIDERKTDTSEWTSGLFCSRRVWHGQQLSGCRSSRT